MASTHNKTIQNEVAASEASKKDEVTSKDKAALLIEAMSKNPFDTVPVKKPTSGSTDNLRDNGSVYSRNSAARVPNTVAARVSSGRFQSLQPEMRNLDIYSTVTSARPATAASGSANRIQVIKNALKAKLGYDWKAIFKFLTRADEAKDGIVSREQFENACTQASVTSLTREELT